MTTAHGELAGIIGRAKSALVSGHVNPDGDSVGSALACYHLLTGQGIATTLYSVDPFPYNFLFLPGADRVTHELPAEEPDLYLIVDAGAPHRVGEPLYRRLQNTKSPKILFDHHVNYHDQGAFFDRTFIDERAAATAVLIYRFISEQRLPMTREIAIALYAAVMADTGSMRYDSTDREAFLTLGELVGWVDPWEVAAKIWEETPLAQLRLLGEVFSSIRLLAGGKAAVFEITQEQLRRYRLGPDHVDGFINYARGIEGVEVAMRFREIGPRLYRVSMRSKGSIDAGLISHEFGGGGHRNAAGFDFSGSFDEACQLVEEIVARVTR